MQLPNPPCLHSAPWMQSSLPKCHACARMHVPDGESEAGLNLTPQKLTEPEGRPLAGGLRGPVSESRDQSRAYLKGT